MMVAGPPGIPAIEYFTTNGTICVESFSHPDYPSDFYSINITRLYQPGENTTLSLNISDCLPLHDSLLCGTLQVSVAAINQLGISPKNQAFIIRNGKANFL